MPWSAHPEGRRHLTPNTVVADAARRRIVSLGALGDLDPSRDEGPHQFSIVVSEFAVLDDGRRVTVHHDRGFTAATNADDIWAHQTAESITRNVLAVVLPDDAEITGEEHEWEWLAELLVGRGFEISAGELRRLPYEVVLTDRVLERLIEHR